MRLPAELGLVDRQELPAQVEDDEAQGHQRGGDNDLDKGREVAELPVAPIAGEADVETVQHHSEGRQARRPWITGSCRYTISVREAVRPPLIYFLFYPPSPNL